MLLKGFFSTLFGEDLRWDYIKKAEEKLQKEEARRWKEELQRKKTEGRM